MNQRFAALNLALTLSATVAALAACDKKESTASSSGDVSGDADKQPADKPEPSLPEAKDIVAQHVEAAGGEAAASAVESLYLKSTYTLDRQNISGTAEVWWQGGKFFATEEVTGFGTARSGYDGSVVWSDDPSHGLRELEGKEAEQWISGGAVFILPEWESYFAKAETVAEREQDGQTVYDVEFTTELGSVTTYSFDKSTHLAASMSFKQILPEATIPVTVTLEDYRPINGEGSYKLPFKEVTDLKMTKMTKVYEAIEVGAEVDPTRFAKPGADGAVPASPEEGAAAPDPKAD